MHTLPLASQISLYVLLALIGLFILLLLGWQVRVLQGRAMRNPDGSVDDWHEQKILFGIAFADVFLACPAGLAGIVLVFLEPRWGHYLLAMTGFWFAYANLATTVASLRFEKPRLTLTWFLVFPFGSMLGVAYLAWAVVHIDAIFRP